MTDFRDLITNYAQSEYIWGMGIDKSTANEGTVSCPAWSVSRLIDIFPNKVYFNGADYYFFSDAHPECDFYQFGYKLVKENNYLIVFTVPQKEIMFSILTLLNWLLIHKQIDKKYLSNE
jgi:hypothetical protein